LEKRKEGVELPRLVWLILTGILCFFATYGLMNAVYWVIIGHDMEHPIAAIIGTSLVPLLLYYLAYRAWKKAGSTLKH